MSGWERGSLMVQCRYRPGWETYKKYWCRGAQWLYCQVLVETKGLQEVKKDRVSIRDNRRDHSIMVTMQDLRRDDNDTYWCGIKKPRADPGTPVRVMVVPGKDFLFSPLQPCCSGLEEGGPCHPASWLRS